VAGTLVQPVSSEVKFDRGGSFLFKMGTTMMACEEDFELTRKPGLLELCRRFSFEISPEIHSCFTPVRPEHHGSADMG